MPCFIVVVCLSDWSVCALVSFQESLYKWMCMGGGGDLRKEAYLVQIGGGGLLKMGEQEKEEGSGREERKVRSFNSRV